MNNLKLRNKIIYSITFFKSFFIVMGMTCIVYAAPPTVKEAATKWISHSKDIARFDGAAIDFHPTQLLDIIARNGHSLSEDVKNELIELGFDFSGKIVTQNRPFIENEQCVDSGIFRFHYTLAGADAVLPEDDDGNGIPDYVDLMVASFDSIAVIDFDRENYTRPPKDDWYFNRDNGVSSAPGSCNVSDSSYYDVYIFNLEWGYYGWVQAEDYAQNFSELTRGDNKNSDDLEQNAVISYMGMRNNYFDFPGIADDIIPVTSAHEFFHAIQYGYDAWEEDWIKEASAVWMEELHYDTINDCYQYLIEFFDYPDRGPNYDVKRGYGAYIYLSYITDNHFDINFIKSFWENSITYNSYDGSYSIETLKQTINQIDPTFVPPFTDRFENITNDFLIANALVTNDAMYNSIYHYDEVANEHWPITEPIYEEGDIPIGSDPIFIVDKLLGTFGAHYYKFNVSDSSLQNISIELLPYYPEEGNLYLTIINDESIQTTHMDTCEQVVDVTDSNEIVFLVSAFSYELLDLLYALRIVPNSTASANECVNNDAPIVSNLTATINENSELMITLLAIDPDFDSLTFSIVDSATHGTLIGNAPILTYTPKPDYNGIDSFTFRASDGVFSNEGTFSITINPVVKSEQFNPSSYFLSENYPNPFNPSTTLSYFIPEEGLVAIDIYNINGQRVKTYTSGRKASGKHSIQWNGKDEKGLKMESGIYLYTMNIDGRVADTKKMLLLK